MRLNDVISAVAMPVMLCGMGLAGCATRPVAEPPPMPSVAPDRQPALGTTLKLDSTAVSPMYTEVLPIDLPTVVGVASANNLDIIEAREYIEINRGRLEAAIGNVFPVLVPTMLYDKVNGRRRNTDGRILNVGFKSWAPGITVEWAINPGKVIYEIVAAKRRLHASEHQAFAVVQETIRRSAVEFYQLVLEQARVAAADQGVKEAEELLRIARVRLQTDTGVKADVLRADARLAQRRQDLVSAIDKFYQASITLALTLRMDAAVTMVPKIESLPPIELVRDDFSIEELMEMAVAFRPDLKQFRELMAAAAADKGATWWSGFGPGLDVSYYYGGLGGQAKNVDPAEGIPGNLIVNPFSPNGSFAGNPLANGLLREGIGRGSKALADRGDRSYKVADSHAFSAQMGWRLSLAAFGELKSAQAMEGQAVIEAERRIDRLKAEVVHAAQTCQAQKKLIELSRQQVDSAEEALRLTQVNLEAGTMTTLDVLQSQDAATLARLRYAESVVRFNQSEVNLLAALGLADGSLVTGRQRESEPGDEASHMSGG